MKVGIEYKIKHACRKCYNYSKEKGCGIYGEDMENALRACAWDGAVNFRLRAEVELEKAKEGVNRALEELKVAIRKGLKR